MKRKSLHLFIVENRKKIDEHIHKRLGNTFPLNDEERRQWILNDEDLYNWARSEGVRI